MNVQSNQLDAYTIFTCCSYLKQYLSSKNMINRYAYINQDKHFFIKLDSIITHAESKAKPIRRQLDYIVFIQSIASFLSFSDKEILEAIDVLINKSEADYTQTSLHNTIDNLNVSCYAKKILQQMVSKALENSEVLNQGLSLLKQQLTTHLTVKSQYLLLGAYLLVLNKCSAKTPLSKALKHALDINRINQPGIETYDLSLGQTEELLDRLDLLNKNKSPLINFKPWANSPQQLTRYLLSLKHNKLQSSTQHLNKKTSPSI